MPSLSQAATCWSLLLVPHFPPFPEAGSQKLVSETPLTFWLILNVSWGFDVFIFSPWSGISGPKSWLKWKSLVRFMLGLKNDGCFVVEVKANSFWGVEPSGEAWSFVTGQQNVFLSKNGKYDLWKSSWYDIQVLRNQLKNIFSMS